MNINAIHLSRAGFALALVVLAAFGAQPATAETGAAEESPKPQPWQAPTWCAHRPAMDIVMGYDEGKYFNLVEARAIQATEAFSQTLCPGDRVRIAEFGLNVDWIGDPIAIQGPAEQAEVVKRFEGRRNPTEKASVNEILVKTASAYWNEPEALQGAMPVLMVFTDTMASDAPKRLFPMDFGWDALPPYFQGRFLTIVNLLERTSSQNSADLLVSTAPEGVDLGSMPSGPRATYTAIMETFIPPPPPPVPTREIVYETIVQDNTPKWLAWIGTPQGAWTAVGAFFVLGILIFGAGRYSRRRRNKHGVLERAVAGHSREVTLVLRDHLHDRVLRQETRLLKSEDALRVAPASNADFVIPGPYAFEVVEDGSELPAIRSANMLGVEIQRAGRRLNVAEGEELPIRSGDRIKIGAGHEVEVQY